MAISPPHDGPLTTVKTPELEALLSDDPANSRLAAELSERYVASGRWIRQDFSCRGFHWRLDPKNCIAQELLKVGVWEPATTRIFEDKIHEGMTVLDVGANIGYFTLLFAKLVGAGGCVHAFEPVRHYRIDLQWHLQRNGLAQRVIVHPYALSNRAEERIIHIGSSSATMHWTNPMEHSIQETIQCRRLDEILPSLELKSFDLLKLDLDGHEPFFLEGAKKSLSTQRPWISVEFAQHCLHVAGSDVRIQERMLRDLGYELFEEGTGMPFPTRMHFLVACGNFDHSANVMAIPLEALVQT